MTTSTILSQNDAEDLHNRGLLFPGKRRGQSVYINDVLNGSSDEEFSNIPLPSNRSGTDLEDAFATLPSTLISRETLQYIGLSSEMGDKVWHRWVNWPAWPPREIDEDDGGLQVTFEDMILDYVEKVQDTYEDDDVRRAIMDVRFREIRLTNSCLFWVKDTISMRYTGLEDIQRTSRDRDMKLSGAAMRISVAQQEAGTGISKTMWHPSMGKDLQQPGMVTLYKAMDQARITGLFSENGEIDLARLRSESRSDFSFSRRLLHFTPDVHVAEYYAAYAKNRGSCEFIVMVCFAISQNAIDSIDDEDKYHVFWPSDQWKQLIWCSRANRKLLDAVKKYEDAQLIIGTISKGADKKYEQLRKWQDVDNSCVLRLGRIAATQYAFSSKVKSLEFLSGRGTLKAFPFSVERLQAFKTHDPDSIIQK